MSEVPLLLVDGHHLLFRAYFGFPARIASRDKLRDLTGLFGFFALLRVAIRDEFEAARHPEVVVVFDGENGVAARRESDMNYKAQRPNDAEAVAPIRSLPDVRRGLDLLDVRWVEIDDAEGDDVIASLAASSPGRPIQIMSGDRDFYQLASSDVRILNTAMKRGSRLVGPAEILSRYGVLPERWCDLVALVGDPSDNFAGIRGVGPVTARRLLAGGLSLEDLPSSGRLNGRLGDRVRAGLDGALATRALVRMRTDVPLTEPVTGCASKALPAPAEVVRLLDLW